MIFCSEPCASRAASMLVLARIKACSAESGMLTLLQKCTRVEDHRVVLVSEPLQLVVVVTVPLVFLDTCVIDKRTAVRLRGSEDERSAQRPKHLRKGDSVSKGRSGKRKGQEQQFWLNRVRQCIVAHFSSRACEFFFPSSKGDGGLLCDYALR